MNPRAAIDELAGATKPWLFGVRHHSPACAVALPPLLDAYAPTAIAVELPADLAPWLVWLGHPDAVAPLAIAGVAADGEDLGFYPFADFSPELVAIRWARARGVQVHAIDLPMGERGGRERGGEHRGIERRLPGAEDDSWEHMVEGPGTLADPERVRRAALLYGWALRMDATEVSELDLAREAFMRAALAKIPGRVAAVIGSFHAAALVAESRKSESVPSQVGEIARVTEMPKAGKAKASPIVSSLIPYGFELLDARSGYPAGIRDPAWQQRLWATQRDRGDVAELVATCLVEITRHVRDAGLPASVPDARAAAEMTLSLAEIRGLAAPGRRELVEAAGTALAQGEIMGRGRIVAKAMEAVLVGRDRGRLAEGTPRSGLAPHVAELLAQLKLPVAPADAVDLRLDPLRSRIDRRRHVALARLRACGVPYGAELESSAAGGVESLTTSWRVKWTPATEAMIELAGLRGVTLRQASAGALRADRARLADDGKVMAMLALVVAAAEAGAGELVTEVLAELTGPRLAEATLPDLIAMLGVIDRIASGHVVALPADPDEAVPGEIDVFAAPVLDRGSVMSAAVASVLGLAGSEALADARSLADLVRIVARPEHAALGDGRLRWSIEQLAQTGTPLIAGAAMVVQVLIGTLAAEQLAIAIGAWLDGEALAKRLAGALAIAGPLFEAAPVFLDELDARVEQMPDADFLARVAALREGFEVLSNASRRRLLESLRDRLGALDVTTVIDPAVLAVAAEADHAGRAAIAMIPRATGEPLPAAKAIARHAIPEHGISVADRWRLILGQERQKLTPRSARAARALDELYGNGHGEGSRGDGGQEQGFPTVRAWREEIEALFGARVFEEVAGKAAEHGRVGALLELDPDSLAPSIELLEQVLSLKGGLGEGNLGKLRALIRRVVDELVRELAVRVRPALSGAIGARATRRPTGVLHLRRTVAANLAKAIVSGDGVQLTPERLFFKQRTRRHLDWHIVLVVDVSGSMEPSVIYSAMMAAILSAVPWIAVKFVAFSTEIINLSEHAGDPLALLLEIAVGGGTHIAKGLRYARSLVTVPQRSLVICVSDFEEGYAIAGLLGEVRALVEAGVTCLGLAALDDRGAPRYAVQIAEQVAAAGMPVAALTPLELARWIGDKIR